MPEKEKKPIQQMSEDIKDIKKDVGTIKMDVGTIKSDIEDIKNYIRLKEAREQAMDDEYVKPNNSWFW